MSGSWRVSTARLPAATHPSAYGPETKVTAPPNHLSAAIPDRLFLCALSRRFVCAFPLTFWECGLLGFISRPGEAVDDVAVVLLSLQEVAASGAGAATVLGGE